MRLQMWQRWLTGVWRVIRNGRSHGADRKRRFHTRPQLEGLECRLTPAAFTPSLDASGNLTITQAAVANDNLLLSLSGGNYTLTDLGGQVFDSPTGAGAAQISGGGTSSIFVASSAVSSISIVLGNGVNVFTLADSGGAAAAPLSVFAGMSSGDQVNITGVWADSGDVALTASVINELGTGAICTNGTLTTNSLIGTTLNGANSVGVFNATNVASGDISLTNVGAPSVIGIAQTGNCTVTLAGGTFLVGSAAALANAGAVAVDGTLDLNGNSIILGTLDGNGTITDSAGPATLTVTGGGNFDGAIVGSNTALTVAGGDLTLGGANYYGGATTVSAGTLTVEDQAVSSTAIFIAGGATLDYDISSFAQQATTTITGTGTLLKTGSGVLVFGGLGNINWELGAGGLIDVEGGILVGGSCIQDFWTQNLSDLNIAAGAIFQGVEANVTIDKLTGSGILQTGWPGAGYVSLNIGVNNGSSTFAGSIQDFAAPGNIDKEGTGTLILTGPNTYTGTTTVSGGTLLVLGGVTTAISAPAISYGSNGMVTVTISSGAGIPQGIVSLSVDEGPAITQVLTNGSSTFTLPGLHAGVHTLLANYQGNLGVSSAIGTITVTPFAFRYTIGSDTQSFGSPAELAADLSHTIATGVNGENLVITYASAGDNATAHVGSYTITGTVADGTGLSSDYAVTLVAGTLTVNPLLVTVTGAEISGVLVTPVVGSLFTVHVGSFQPAFAATASDFAAIIDWGDGTVTAGSITSNGSGGFDVAGTHSYAAEETVPVTLTVMQLISGAVYEVGVGSAVVLTGGQNQQLESLGFGFLPPGGGTVTETTTGISATFVLPDGSPASGTLSVADFGAPPVPEDIVKNAFPDHIQTSSGKIIPVVLSFFDVRATGVTPGASLTVTFHYSDTADGVPELDFFDPTTQTFQTVRSAAPLVIDPVAHTVQVEFSDSSFPTIGEMGGTVFTVAVAAPPPPDPSSSSTAAAVSTTAIVTPTLASSAVPSAFGQTLTLQTNEGVSVTVVSKQDSSSSGSSTKVSSGGVGNTTDDGTDASSKEKKADDPLEGKGTASPKDKAEDKKGEDNEETAYRTDKPITRFELETEEARPMIAAEPVAVAAAPSREDAPFITRDDTDTGPDAEAAADEPVLRLGAFGLVFLGGRVLCWDRSRVDALVSQDRRPALGQRQLA